MEKLVLIDGNSLINRAFYAMPILSTKKGEYTNAVYGFMNMLKRIIEEDKPTHIGVAFDLKHPTFRHKLFDQYKGTRKPMPMELRPQIPLLKEVLSLMGIKTFELAGFEADDIIGTIAKKTDVCTYVYTGDKDSFQLVDEQTEVHFTKHGVKETENYTLSNFKEKMGIDPLQIIDLKALMGDSSDNIPGVAGIGEKTALNLVQTYGQIENLYENTNELKGKLKEKIELGKDSAFLSKTLATIDTDCPIEFTLDDMLFSLPLPLKAKERFIELEFKAFYTNDKLFAEVSQSNENLSDKETKKIDVDKVVLTNLSSVEKIIVDKTSLYIGEDSVNLFDGKTEYVLPLQRTLLDEGFSLSAILNALKNTFTGNKTLIVFDRKEMRHLLKKTVDIDFTCPAEDISLIKYLADYSGGAVSQKEVIAEYQSESDLPACALYLAYESLYKKLIDEKMENLYREVELPLTEVLYSMESAGFKVDQTSLYEIGEVYAAKLKQLEKQIRELTEEPNLNINSPKQLGEVLFDKLKIGKGKKTKTGYSTSAETLEKFEDTHPSIPLILEYRKLQKLASTYIEGFKPLIEKETGLIHTSFNQTVTSTGRLSSKEPNLQNIPVRDEQGKELRKFFVPRDENHILIGADYSQIELRLLAAFSDCLPLITAFALGKDIHTATASKVFKTPLEKVTKQMRSNAKAVNFGIIYGISEYGLAKQINVSPFEAKGYITSYFLEYPEVKQYMEQNVEFAKNNGYSTTILGRRRYIREINSSNFMQRSFGERAAMNMPLQGSSADIIKLAMLGVYNRLKKENLQSQLILQVHDELIIDALISEKERVEKILVEEMENVLKLSVKLTVEVGSGKTWYDAK